MSKKGVSHFVFSLWGSILEVWISGPGERKIEFQYDSSWFGPDPLKLLKKNLAKYLFFLEDFPISHMQLNEFRCACVVWLVAP